MYFCQMPKHLVAILVFDGFQLLDASGPASVFGLANSIAGDTIYDVQMVSPDGGLVRSSCGVPVHSRAIAKVPPNSVDTLLTSGGHVDAMAKAVTLPKTRRWIKRCADESLRFGSICSGTYVLARAEVLTGLKVATHWASCGELARLFPDISVDSNSLFVVDGKCWTSAGVSTGIDMAIAMTEQDIGRSTADRIARFLVLYARRPGYQSQFSSLLKAQSKAETAFAELTSWIQTRLDQELDVPALAARAGLSERTFYRRFVASTGQTPAYFVQSIRLDAARVLLSSNLSLKEIAAKTGNLSPTRLSAAFERRFGLSPALFRKLHCGDRRKNTLVRRQEPRVRQ
jgi:transcriptional regulator GlxA family with amidase domain